MNEDRIRVLQIEYNAFDASLVRNMLKSATDAEFDLYDARLLSTGLEQLEKCDIDAVLLDLSLPDCNGLDAVAAVRSQLGDKAPIIVLTTLHNQLDATTSLEFGAQDYLFKEGIDTDHLSRTIRYAIGRKQGEQLLRDHREIISASPEEDAVIMMDSQGDIIFWDDSAEKIFGYTIQDIIGKPLYSTLASAQYHTAYLKEFYELRETTSSTFVGKKLELMASRKDGTVLPIELSLSPIRGKAQWSAIGIVHGVSGLTSVIDNYTYPPVAQTDEYQYETNLPPAFSNSILDSIPDMVVTFDSDTKITYINPSFLKFIGRQFEDVVGKPLETILNESDALSSSVANEMVERARTRLRTGEAATNVELQLQNIDGTTMPCIYSASVIASSQGERLGEVVVMREITELGQRETATCAIENWDNYRNLLDYIDYGYFLFDDQDRLYYHNLEGARLTGYTKDELHGTGFSSLFPPTAIPLVTSQCKATLEREKIIPFTTQVVRKDGISVPIEITQIQRIQIEGAMHLAVLISDISERNKAQEELRRKNQEIETMSKELHEFKLNFEQKLNERTTDLVNTLRQKDEFVNQLGHDLKSPLTPIVTLLHLLKRQEQAPEQTEVIEAILANAEYMSELVTKTLQLASLNSPHTQLNIEHVNLWTNVSRTIKNKSHILSSNGIKVKNKIDKGIFVQADSLRLQELVDNILINAIKHTPAQGTITFDAKIHGDFVKVSIRDTGEGIAKEQLPSIFDEFYKVDRTKYEPNSSGLGLAICKRIIEKHGGKIWVASPGLGKGSTFFFTLILCSQNEEQGHKYSISSPLNTHDSSTG
ncbi:MAG: PAS domain S-box protein [Chloroflexota bacterium]|nr:PAS domain S-box protein [Chloroflexota bacterium]